MNHLFQNMQSNILSNMQSENTVDQEHLSTCKDALLFNLMVDSRPQKWYKYFINKKGKDA